MISQKFPLGYNLIPESPLGNALPWDLGMAEL